MNADVPADAGPTTAPPLNSFYGSVRSDEPTRVRQLTDGLLAGQSGSAVGPSQGPQVRLVVGADARDDCAVYECDGSLTLVAGTDYVRGPRFTLYELGLLSGFDIGYYLVAANVSDVAAMGAAPIGVLTVIRYPKELDDEGFHEILAGVHQACADFGTLNVGGDIGNAERIILSGTALGVCHPGRVLTRRGAKPGDILCVTGACGLLGAGVAYFPKREANGWSLASEAEQALLDGWRQPQARVAEGRLLSVGGFATSCQDTSDGLKATIEQLAEASGVGFDIRQTQVPIEPVVAQVAALMGVDSLALSMSASADFHLAFTVRATDLDACQESFAANGLRMYPIGQTTAEPNRITLTTADGVSHPLPGVTWKHQTTDISTLLLDHAPPGPGETMRPWAN